MEIADLRAQIAPLLDFLRGIIMKIAEILAPAFKADVNNVYLICLVVISFFIGKWLFNLFYVNTEGRYGTLIMVILLIFGILKWL